MPIERAPLRLALRDALPESRRMVHVTGMGQLVTQQVAHHCGRLEQQRQVQRDDAARRTTAPARTLSPQSYRGKRKSVSLSQLLQLDGEHLSRASQQPLQQS